MEKYITVVVRQIKILKVTEWLSVILAIIAFGFNVLVVDFTMSKFIWMAILAYYISGALYAMLSVCEN